MILGPTYLSDVFQKVKKYLDLESTTKWKSIARPMSGGAARSELPQGEQDQLDGPPSPYVRSMRSTTIFPCDRSPRGMSVDNNGKNDVGKNCARGHFEIVSFSAPFNAEFLIKKTPKTMNPRAIFLGKDPRALPGEGMHGGGVGSGGITSGAEGRVWSAVEGVGPTRGERRCRGARVGAAGGAVRFSSS